MGRRLKLLPPKRQMKQREHGRPTTLPVIKGTKREVMPYIPNLSRLEVWKPNCWHGCRALGAHRWTRTAKPRARCTSLPQRGHGTDMQGTCTHGPTWPRHGQRLQPWHKDESLATGHTGAGQQLLLGGTAVATEGTQLVPGAPDGLVPGMVVSWVLTLSCI